jgi:arsenite oxidase large subunit
VEPRRTAGEETAATRERLTCAWVRTASGLQPIDTDAAVRIVARLITQATELQQEDGKVLARKPRALGARIFEYQFLENTFAATTLLFRMIGTPNVAFHDRPSVASNTQGFDDSGVDAHGYAYEDIWASDVVLIAGANPYETQSVFFMQNVTGKKLIVIDPRKTITADYAVRTGGVHLRPRVLGSDAWILMALCREIVRRRALEAWPDRTPRALIASATRLDALARAALRAPWTAGPGPARLAHHLLAYDEFVRELERSDPADGTPLYDTAKSREIAGIEPYELERVAKILAGPASDEGLPDASTRRTSLLFEKGLIWGFGYSSTAAMANLGLLCGSVIPPGHDTNEAAPLGVVGRIGGHQKGWAEAAGGYPFRNSVDFVDLTAWGGAGRFPVHHTLDPHLVGTAAAPRTPGSGPDIPAPEVRLLWTVGCNPVGQIGAAAEKWAAVSLRRSGEVPKTPDETEVLRSLQQRMANGGLVHVQQEIYLNPTSDHADVILPATGWGEEPLTRYTGERRLRLYGKFQDAPRHRPSSSAPLESSTRCRPDWQYFRDVMTEIMTLVGADRVGEVGRAQLDSWRDAATVFLDMATSSNRARLLQEIVTGDEGLVGHALLARRGTRGVLLPGQGRASANEPLRDTPRIIPPPTRRVSFQDMSGARVEVDLGAPFAFVRVDWLAIRGHVAANRPRKGELTLVNGRVNELWNSMFSNIRNATVQARWPDDMPGTWIEMHPDDAKASGVGDGDVVELACDDIHLAGGSRAGQFRAVVRVAAGRDSEHLVPGIAFALFSYPVTTARAPEFPWRTFSAQGYVNNVTTGYVDPWNPTAALKFGRVRVARVVGSYLNAASRGPGPSFEARHVSEVVAPAGLKTEHRERLWWQLRELLVQHGLVRWPLHGKRLGKLLRDPDRLMEALRDPATGEPTPLFDHVKSLVEAGFMTWDTHDAWSPLEVQLLTKIKPTPA